MVEEGFVEAGELEIGDEVETADGERLFVTDIRYEYLDVPVTVYNFEVADWHTYYVSDEDVLVHNKCEIDSTNYLNQLDNFSENKINHIINGSKNSDHGWEKLVPDKNWNGIKNIIAQVMDVGVEGPYKSVFSKKAIVNGFEVEVTYAKLADGTVKISDAWVIH